MRPVSLPPRAVLCTSLPPLTPPAHCQLPGACCCCHTTQRRADRESCSGVHRFASASPLALFTLQDTTHPPYDASPATQARSGPPLAGREGGLPLSLRHVCVLCSLSRTLRAKSDVASTSSAPLRALSRQSPSVSHSSCRPPVWGGGDATPAWGVAPVVVVCSYSFAFSRAPRPRVVRHFVQLAQQSRTFRLRSRSCWSWSSLVCRVV